MQNLLILISIASSNTRDGKEDEKRVIGSDCNSKKKEKKKKRTKFDEKYPRKSLPASPTAESVSDPVLAAKFAMLMVDAVMVVLVIVVICTDVVVDHPTQLIFIWIFICYVNIQVQKT